MLKVEFKFVDSFSDLLFHRHKKTAYVNKTISGFFCVTEPAWLNGFCRTDHLKLLAFDRKTIKNYLPR